MSIWTPDTRLKDRWVNFSYDEMACTHCGENHMDSLFMGILQNIRRATGSLTVTSGYRCPQHPVEAAKEAPGAHTFGKAVDIAVRGPKAVAVVRQALEWGVERIGVQQKGDNRFLHLDTMTNADAEGRFPRPMLFSY